MHVPSAAGSRSSQGSSSVRPRRGRGTRSVGVESSTVGPWLLQGPAPGGPKIIDLIPSFGGHITYRMCREGVACRPASTLMAYYMMCATRGAISAIPVLWHTCQRLAYLVYLVHLTGMCSPITWPGISTAYIHTSPCHSRKMIPQFLSLCVLLPLY